MSYCSRRVLFRGCRFRFRVEFFDFLESCFVVRWRGRRGGGFGVGGRFIAVFEEFLNSLSVLVWGWWL